MPIRFDPSMEHIAENEAETHAAMIETLLSISETTFAHSGHATRSVHAKSHGVLRGKVTVLPGLPPDLAQGLFAKPGEYRAALRFSTIPGDVLDDHVSTPRGLAVKIIDVDGPRLPGSEADTTQDFVMINGPAFGAPNAEAFLGNLKAVARTTDKAEGLKIALSAVARLAEDILEAFGHKSSTILTLGGQPLTHILGETYYFPGGAALRRLHRQDRRCSGVAAPDRADRSASRHDRQAERPAPGCGRVFRRQRCGVGNSGPALHRPGDNAH
jgi:hypothetical protein